MNVGTRSEGIIEIPLSHSSHILKYLERDVDPVALPELGALEETYPPLILDGASGVGKTQQAFALLKKHGSIVYLLLSEANQSIYQEMITLCELNRFHTLYDDYVHKLEASTTEGHAGSNQDPFSTQALNRALGSSVLNDFLQFFAESILRYDSRSDKTLKLGSNAGRRKVAIVNELENCILFIDEALPRDCEHKHKNRLRFARNLGRILKMRVVPAGTAAVVANMIDEKIGQGREAASRQNIETSGRWAMCNFLWKSIKKNEQEKITASFEFQNFDQNAIQEALQLERPLFVHLFLSNIADGGIFQVCSRVGFELCEQKGLDENYRLKTLWLSGAWLAKRNNWTTSQHKIKASQLVSGHFFEPAIMVSEKKEPFLRSGMAQLSSVPGPLVATLYRIKSGETTKPNRGKQMWVLSAQCDGEDSRRDCLGRIEFAAATENFDHVKAALSICVQQCLAREPLLAIALSSQHRLSVEEFKQGIYCFQESQSEQSLSALSGELLELLVFAALQLANGNDMKEPNTVEDFCDNLVKYLSPNAHTEQNTVGERIIDKLKIPNIFSLAGKFKKRETLYSSDGIGNHAAQLRKKKKKGDETETLNNESEIPRVSHTDAEQKFGNIRIPWLVPAYSLTGLMESCTEAHRQLFVNENIAALIPGSSNASCDIDAYKWPLPKDEDAKLIWKFEVKGRNGDYSLEKGEKDLVQKCGDDSDATGLHHAMLIAVRRQWETASRVWEIEKGGEKFLRVVLLISGY